MKYAIGDILRASCQHIDTFHVLIEDIKDNRYYYRVLEYGTLKSPWISAVDTNPVFQKVA